MEEMEKKTADLMSQLESLLIRDPDLIMTQEMAYRVIQKVSDMYQIPLENRTLDISSSESCDDSQDVTWEPDSREIEILGIYSGKGKSGAPNDKKRTFSKTDRTPEKSPIFVSKRRNINLQSADSLSPCMSPFHTCRASCDGVSDPPRTRKNIKNEAPGSPSQCSFDRESNFSDFSDDAFAAICDASQQQSLPKPKLL